MGEAKKRGNQAERVKQALENYKVTPIETVKAQLGLPDTAEFLGYVIHLPDKDEFLAAVKNDNIMKQWAWSKTPEHALRFDDFRKAVKECNDCKGNPIIALLFDVNDKYYVGWA